MLTSEALNSVDIPRGVHIISLLIICVLSIFNLNVTFSKHIQSEKDNLFM